MSLRSRLGLNSDPLYLMDGSAFIFRSFYAYRNMTRSDGFPTNALFMVARLILKLLREERPSLFGFIMDGKGPTFRHERFAEYKAQRSATPEPLVQQLAPLKELLGLLGLPVIVSEGCEADDCIASLARRFREERPVIILGADKDLKQCLHEDVVLWDPAAKDEKITTLSDFQKETGMEPSSWPDYQALVGDSSDNIPGVPQVGPKTAVGLIQEFRTLEKLFDNLPAVPPKVRVKLEGQRDKAMLYRELTRLDLAVCPETDGAALALRPVSLPPVLAFMAEYELRSLAREIESMVRIGYFGTTAEAGPGAKPESPAVKSPTSAPPPKPAVSKEEPRAGGLLAGSASGPQPVTPPPASRKAGEQGSLLDAGALPAADFAKAATIAAMPLHAGVRALAVLPLEEGVLVAAEEWERLYTGPLAEVERFLTGDGAAALLIAPDVKTLCKTYPCLWSIAPERWFDLSLAAYLLSPEDRGYGWEQVASRWGEPAGSPYSLAEHPGLLALVLQRFMAEQLSGSGLTQVFTGLELPLVPVLAAMEERGITVDQQAFASFLAEVQADLGRLTARIHERAGRVFNIRSSQQLADVLFSVLDLPASGKTKGGAASTSQEALEKLIGKHPIIDDILEYRKLEKLRSTYLEPLPKLADANGRIHTTFNQTATATGRLSSSNPNLQNIPIRGPLGVRMRGCFVAPGGGIGREPGMRLVCADYSQIELRVLAHLSGDPTLLEAFRNNEDIHSRTAGLLFDVPLGEVSPDQRRSAKTINFGLIYGMGAQRLAQDLHISVKEAKAFIERYFSRLSKLKEFYEAIEEEAKEHGYVATMTGRRRMTPDILSQNNQLRSQARRQAINTRIQGSAADIIKLAMLAVENDDELKRLEARLLLQIHDELLLEAPAETAQAAGERLAALMSAVRPGGQTLSVPLLVEWGTGVTWAEAH